MKPVQQRYRHNPPESYGDCHRAVIASLLELELDAVPHFGDGLPPGPEFKRRVVDFLKTKDLIEVAVGFICDIDHIYSVMKTANPGAFYILGGQSNNGVNHSVVCFEDKIVHDPSIDQSGIVGPCDDGAYWISVLAHQPNKSP